MIFHSFLYVYQRVLWIIPENSLLSTSESLAIFWWSHRCLRNMITTKHVVAVPFRSCHHIHWFPNICHISHVWSLDPVSDGCQSLMVLWLKTENMFNHHLEVTKVTEARTSKIAQNVTLTPPMYFFCSLAKKSAWYVTWPISRLA